MMYDVIFKNGNVVDVKNEQILQADIAVKDGKILGKPSEIPEGKLDIDVSQKCTSDHIVEPTTPEETTPGTDGEGTTTDPSTGTGGGSTETTTPTNPVDDPNFGIQ